MLTLTCPYDHPLRRATAGAKLLALALGTTALFLTSGVWIAAAALAGVVALHLVGDPRALPFALRRLWPLWPFALVAVLWHLWRGTPVEGAGVLLRMAAAVMAANLVTMTTRLDDMIAALTRALSSLRPLIPPRRLALALALAIRFVPDLMQSAARLAEAWRARSPRRPFHRLLPPLTLAAIDTADHAAEALRARGGTD
jgi:biotin transport system permease protein